MNRLNKKISELKRKKRKALVAFVTAGYPDIKSTEGFVKTFAENGVDIVELGVPFSDPIADGPTIQYSSEYALRKGINLNKILNSVKRMRRKMNLPILLMSYLNPIYKMGMKNAAKKIYESGADGLIVPDLIPEESRDISRALKKYGLAEVFLAAPNTPLNRLKFIDSKSRGFLYAVSVTGVTGKRAALPSQTGDFLLRLKKNARRNLKFLGFGISSVKQVAEIKKSVDGIIVGSAIIELIKNNKGQKRIKKLASFMQNFRKALDS